MGRLGWLVALIAAGAALFFWRQTVDLQTRLDGTVVAAGQLTDDARQLAEINEAFDDLDRGFSRALNAQDAMVVDFAALTTPAEQSEQRAAFVARLAKLKEDLEPRAKLVRDHLLKIDPPEYKLDPVAVSDDANAAFLARIDADPSYTQTASGLRYKAVRTAEGGAQPTAASEVSVHYRGAFIEGTEFDSSYKRNEPATFPLGSLIPGWVEGIPLMREGEIYELVLPYRLAYGVAGRSAIPPRQTLVFQVELLKVLSEPAKAAP